MKITVFTPTYNRAYILHNLYTSLKQQTFHDFEWLIVDDGSEDGTKDLIDKWKTENTFFPICYHYQQNAGKHAAINKALDLAKGELFFTVDSDDFLTEDALEKIVEWERDLPKNDKYCGIAGNLGVSKESTPNEPFAAEFLDKTLLDRYTYQENGKYVLGGERAYVFYTKVHKNYKYPIFEGEKFMTEAVVWNRMASDGYLMRFFKDIIWIYEYKEDGLTMAGSSLFINNPRGYGLWLKEKSIFLNESIVKRLKLYYTYTCDLLQVYSDSDLIAKSIGAPRLLIKLIILGRKIIKQKDDIHI